MSTTKIHNKEAIRSIESTKLPPLEIDNYMPTAVDFETEEISEVARATLDFEQALESLPPEKKLLALLGINKILQTKEVPVPFTTISAKLKREDLPRFQEIMNDHAIQCNSEFLGNNEDEEINLTYIIPSSESIKKIIRTLKKHSIDSSINLAEYQTLILSINNQNPISLHNLLNNSFEDKQNKAIDIDEVELAIHSHTSPLEPINETFNTSFATPTSLYRAQLASKRPEKLPRQGHCVYMMINQDMFEKQSEDDINLKRLINELSLIKDSNNFFITSYNGYLTIIDTAERGGASLTAMASRIYRHIPHAQIFLGDGEIEHSQNQFSIKNFPNITERNSWQKMTNAIYMTENFTELITDPNKRASALCEIEYRPLMKEQLSKLLSFRAKPTLKIGGPDRLIGYTDEHNALLSQMTDGKTKLVILKGGAGMGKSRITDEVLKQLPSSIICSLDPSGERTTGFGLMTIAEQINDKLRNDTDLSDTAEAKALENYDKQPQKIKLRYAEKKPEKLLQLCSNAIKIMNHGKTPLVIDDLHHTDRFSLPYITKLVQSHLLQYDAKAIILLRPEEIYEPQALKTLSTKMQTMYSKTKSVSEIELHGLDFENDEKLAHDFVYYSLPIEIRTGKNLGSWHKELAKIAKQQPFVLKSLMDGILEDTENNLDYSAEVIQLKKSAEDTLQDIFEGKSDLKTYYQERLQKLNPNALLFLQCISLMGGKVSTEQGNIIAKKISGLIKKKDLKTAVARLIKGGYLVKNNDNWQLQHDTTLDIVVDSIPNLEKQINLAGQLHQNFKHNTDLHPDIRFNLANNIANHQKAPSIDNNFWTEYIMIARQCLIEAKNLNSIGRGYNVSSKVLDSKQNSTIPSIVELLSQTGRSEEKEEIPTEIKSLIILSLYSNAENAMYLGRFDETDKNIEILENIYKHSIEDGTNLDKIYLLAFQKAYLQRDLENMKKIFEEKIQNNPTVSESAKIIAEIKIKFRERKYKEASDIFYQKRAVLDDSNKEYKDIHGSTQPEFMEALRLAAARCPFELIRNTLKQNLDEDIEIQPGTISAPIARQLLEIKDHLESLKRTQNENPFIFNKYEELALLEQIGLINAYLGNYDTTIESLHEAWRQSDQMEIHEQAARVAKFKGDIQVMQGISIIEKTPNPMEAGQTAPRESFNRQALLAAIKTYSEQGILSVSNMDKTSFYPLAMRIQRIRAVGLLAISYKDQLMKASHYEIEQIEEELSAHIQKALNDFEFINKISQELNYHTDDEVCYYLLGYLGHILDIAKALSIEIPSEILNSPFLKRPAINLGLNFLERKELSDQGLGEVDRKKHGLERTEILMGHKLGLQEIF